MRYLNRTIILLVVFSLATVNLAPAQEPPKMLTISGNTEVGGVMMKGLPIHLVTDENGLYSVNIDYGWSGTVAPTKEGYLFVPGCKVYTKVNSDRTNENYTPKIITYTISGQVEIPGVMMQGLPGNPVTDENGLYSTTVEYGWAGTVEPAKEGYTFKPANKNYPKVIANLKNQNYTAEQQTFTISDVIMVAGKPIPGIRVSASNGGQSSVTDARGRFNVTVPYGWSGELTLEKEGLVFSPSTQLFANVTSNIRDGWPENEQPVEWGYGGRGWEPTRAGAAARGSRRIGRSTGYGSAISPTADRKVLVVPAVEVKAEDLAEIMEDMQVMSLILDERFKETRRVQGAFTDFGDFFGRDNRTTEAIYLQGYGVLFSMEVNFAFSPPPKPQGQGAEQTAENVDSTWQKARQQVFSPGDPRSSRGSNSAEEYNSQMVEELKRDLITTLKHAANIRGVQDDELVILTVIGGGRQSGGVYGGGGFMMGSMGGSSGSGGDDFMGGMMGTGMISRMGGMSSGMSGMSSPGEMGVSPATVLTIRAKKSDIDAYAKGEQILVQFQQKVQIFTY